MANLLFLDSFDHYSKAQASRKWTNAGGIASIGVTNGRTGNGAQIGPLNTYKTFGVEYPTLTIGIAFNTPNFSNNIVFAFNGPVGISAGLAHYGDGRLYVSAQALDSAGSLFPDSPPSTFVVNIGQWYYAEFSTTVSITNDLIGGTYTVTITYEARINETTILSGTLSKTRTGSTTAAGAGWAGFGVSSPGGGLNASYDDLYVTDGEFLGDIKIGVLYPNAAGDSTGWTPTPAAANYANVKEHPADDNATIVTAATAGLKDLYNLDNIPPSFVGTIKGAQALWLVKKSDSGSAAVKGVWKSGATEIDQSAGVDFIPPDGFHPSAASYLYDIDPQRKSLFTAADWDVTEVNALQLGIKRTV